MGFATALEKIGDVLLTQAGVLAFFEFIVILGLCLAISVMRKDSRDFLGALKEINTTLTSVIIVVEVVKDRIGGNALSKN